MTQEEINKAKALVVSFGTCPSNKAYIPTWSSAIDPYQQANINKLVEAIKTAETTKKAEDIKVARKLADEFLTVTNADMKKAAEDFDVQLAQDRKSTRLNSSHANISYAVFCLKKKKN